MDYVIKQSLGERGIPGCLAVADAEAVSHHNLYYSILGIMSVRDQSYRARLDLVVGCRAPTWRGGEE